MRMRALISLMIIAFVVVTGFQIWWLQTNYSNEKNTLTIRASAAFNEMIGEAEDSVVQAAIAHRFPEVKLFDIPKPAGGFTQLNANDSLYYSSDPDQQGSTTVPPGLKHQVRVARGKLDQSGGQRIIGPLFHKSVRGFFRSPSSPPDRVSLVSYQGDSLLKHRNDTNGGSFSDKRTEGFHFVFSDSTGRVVSLRLDSVLAHPFKVEQLSRIYAKKLRQLHMNTPFTISAIAADKYAHTNTISAVSGSTVYFLNLPNATAFLYKAIALPIGFSFFLIALTGITFILLYRGLQKQRKLAEIKNEFISNITHELKTPIATVGVAIEALKNFSAIDDPEKKQEYLEASQNELHRLTLLVDKVMRLSLFEKKGVQINREMVNLSEMVNEVTASMRLQFEKRKAVVSVSVAEDTRVYADRMHLESVVFNLLDNALKYSNGEPVIQVDVQKKGHNVQLSVCDNGIGIPAEYHQKVFEKFFRVPHGNTHNIKGYGLGLNYVWQVIKEHGGTTVLLSKPGGTQFIITIGSH